MGIWGDIKDSLISARSTWVRRFYLRGRPKKLICWGEFNFRHLKLEMPLGYPSGDVKKAVGYVGLE